MIKLLFLTLLTVSLVVTADEHDNNRWRINPTLGYQHFDNDRNIEDGNLVGLGLDYRFNESWGTELIYLHGSLDTEIDHLILEGKYFFAHSSNQDFSPYMAVGLSHSEYAHDVIGEYDSRATVVGPGVYYAFNDRWSSKVDVRWFHDLKGNLNDSSLTVAISYRLGRIASKPHIGDADNDGVNDLTDQCPLTPAGAAVDVNGCELDTDRDGVVNSKDQCLYTPLGARVYTDGCAAKLARTETISLNVTFETNSSQLADSFIPEIEKVARFMTEYVSVTGVIEGHTDSIGSVALNKQLSQRRAETVRNILLDKFDVDPKRLIAIGYGEEKPIATNFFSEGRQQNRRVEAVFKAQITE